MTTFRKMALAAAAALSAAGMAGAVASPATVSAAGTCTSALYTSSAGQGRCTGTSSSYRVRLRCFSVLVPGDSVYAYGPWQGAGNWSTRVCNAYPYTQAANPVLCVSAIEQCRGGTFTI